MEDAQPAREQGRSMAEFRYTPETNAIPFAQAGTVSRPILYQMLRAGRRSGLRPSDKGPTEERRPVIQLADDDQSVAVLTQNLKPSPLFRQHPTI